MISLTRYKSKLKRTSTLKSIATVLIFLVYLVWGFVNYIVHVSTAARLPGVNDFEAKVIQLGESPRSNAEGFPNSKRKIHEKVDDIKENTDSSYDSSDQALILKEINRKFIKLTHNFLSTTISGNTATTSKTTKSINAKPSIDMVNDYYPFVDFKFVFPEIWPKVDITPNMFMIVLVNSGAKVRKNREATRQTWGNQSNCEQRKALGDERQKDLRWKLAVTWTQNQSDLFVIVSSY